MKKKILFTTTAILMTIGTIAQNMLLNGNFEEQGAWKIIQETGGTVTFGDVTHVPSNGNGGCVYITDQSPYSGWDQETFIYQTVTFEVGAKYEFSGALKCLYEDTDNPKFWIEIMMMPVDDWDMEKEHDPDWDKWGCPSSALFKITQDDQNWMYYDNTFKDVDNNDYIGAFTGVFHANKIYGDTTIFTLPQQYPSAGGLVDLGPIGTKVDFFVILYTGIGPAGVDDFKFSFDEFSLIKIKDGSTGINKSTFNENISVYPNPSKGIFNLKINDSYKNISLSVVNLTGQVVWQKEIASSQINSPINLSSLDKGYYLLKISNNKETSVKSIVIK